jgi:hypothetical protein
MASKNPIVCVGPLNGNAAAIIQSCEAGETFEKENIEGITNYLIALFKTFTDNRTLKLSNQLYQQYSRKNLSKLMSDLIHE